MGHITQSYRHALVAAARHGHHKWFGVLLKMQSHQVQSHQVNKVDKNGRTLLYLAAEGGHDKVVKVLLEKEDINVNKADIYGRSPLYMAARRGHDKVVRLLLEMGNIDVNQVDECFGRNVLISAASGAWKARGKNCEVRKGENCEVVKLLLGRADINVNKKDKHGKDALHWAVFSIFNNFEVAKLLLQRDDINVNQADENGFTPLYMAADDGNVKLVELLVGHKDIQLTKAIKSGDTPLSIAMKWGQSQAKYDSIVRIILEQLIKPQDENSTCIVCMDKRPEVVLVPCGHQNMCSPCASKWDGEQKGCPMDRIKISGILPLYVWENSWRNS